jgi:hypothetical protein
LSSIIFQIFKILGRTVFVKMVLLSVAVFVRIAKSLRENPILLVVI